MKLPIPKPENRHIIQFEYSTGLFSGELPKATFFERSPADAAGQYGEAGDAQRGLRCHHVFRGSQVLYWFLG